MPVTADTVRGPASISSVAKSCIVVWARIASSSSAAVELSAWKPSPGSERSGSSWSSSSSSSFRPGARSIAWRRSRSISKASCLSRLVGRQQQVAHLPRRARRGPDEAADHLAEEQLGPGGGGVDADPQAGDVDPLAKPSAPRPASARSEAAKAGDPGTGSGLVAHHDLRQLRPATSSSRRAIARACS